MVEQSQTRVHVASSQTRCPYCHDQVQIEELHQVCSTCLARHHDDCWTSHGSCSNCGHFEALIPSRQEQTRTSGNRDLELNPLLGSRIESQKKDNALEMSWAQSFMSKREKLLLACFLLSLLGEFVAAALHSELGIITLFALPILFLILMLVESKQGLKARLVLDSEGLTYSNPGQLEGVSMAWDDLDQVTLKMASPRGGESHPHSGLAQNGLILKKRSGELKVGSSFNAIEAEWLKCEIQRARDYFKRTESSKKLDR